MPSGWSSYLPLSRPSDIRGRLLTPEAALRLSAAPDDPIGVTFGGNTFTTGIEANFLGWTAIRFSTTGTLPSPLIADTTYYVFDLGSANAFQVAPSIGGTPLTLTGAGSGSITVRNWSLNDTLEAKIALADQYLYDSLLTLVMDHIRPWSMNTFYGYFPIVGYGPLVATTPRDRAAIVLDNITNASDLMWASVDVAIWLMTEDGALRNQLYDSSFEQYRGQSLESRKKELADESIAAQARLLVVDTAAGAFGLFNFDQVTDSVSVCLL